jgi:predicted DNA binding CopG/RHH family protein
MDNKSKTQNKKKEPWDDMVFYDDEERELYESVERGEWKSVENLEEEKAKAQAAARHTLALIAKKSESVSIRLSPYTLNRIKAKAMEEGLPYQTLIASIIHQYANGKKLV